MTLGCQLQYLNYRLINLRGWSKSDHDRMQLRNFCVLFWSNQKKCSEVNYPISRNLLETYVRIFQNITFICFHQNEKNWNNTVIFDQLVFYSSRMQCSNSIQFYGSCTVVKALAKIADEAGRKERNYILDTAWYFSLISMLLGMYFLT